MAAKRIVLSQHHNPDFMPGADATIAQHRYRVEELNDSVDYAIGDFLDKREVDRLCGRDDWKVVVKGAK